MAAIVVVMLFAGQVKLDSRIQLLSPPSGVCSDRQTLTFGFLYEVNVCLCLPVLRRVRLDPFNRLRKLTQCLVGGGTGAKQHIFRPCICRHRLGTAVFQTKFEGVGRMTVPEC